MNNQKTRAVLLFVPILAFAVLLFGGYLMNKEKPPIPQTVVTSGAEVFSGKDVIAAE